MKFSYNWIRELVPGLDTEPGELMRLITMKTAECEGLERVGRGHRDRGGQQVADASAGFVGPLRNGARGGGDYACRMLRDPVKLDLLPKGEAPVGIEIEDFALCPRYSALVFENVTVRPSPLWLQYRLEAIGLNAINNIVDVTNYVMAELAQPMHAFDAEKLHGPTIFVRNARAGRADCRVERGELQP